jgi:hypothetical protein
MYRNIGKEYLLRAGRSYLYCEVSGRMMAARREEYKSFWEGVHSEDFDAEGEKNWREKFAEDKKKMADELWKEGDRQLKDNKDLEASLMTKVFIDGMETVIKNCVDQHATWMEREVRKEDGIEAGLGSVLYATRCIRTAGNEPKDKNAILEAKVEMERKTDRRKANWRDDQFTPLPNAFVESLGQDSPKKTPVKPSAEQESTRKLSMRDTPQTPGKRSPPTQTLTPASPRSSRAAGAKTSSPVPKHRSIDPDSSDPDDESSLDPTLNLSDSDEVRVARKPLPMNKKRKSKDRSGNGPSHPADGKKAARKEKRIGRPPVNAKDPPKAAVGKPASAGKEAQSVEKEGRSNKKRKTGGHRSAMKSDGNERRF